MSISSDGIICYGICFGEEFEFPFGCDVEDEDGNPLEHEEFDDWYVDVILGVDSSEMDYKEKSDIINNSQLELCQHCSYDYPMYILCIRGTEHKAWRGDPTLLDFEEMNKFVTPEAVAELKRVAKIIDPDCGEPGWWLASLYG